MMHKPWSSTEEVPYSIVFQGHLSNIKVIYIYIGQNNHWFCPELGHFRSKLTLNNFFWKSISVSLKVKHSEKEVQGVLLFVAIDTGVLLLLFLLILSIIHLFWYVTIRDTRVPKCSTISVCSTIWDTRVAVLLSQSNTIHLPLVPHNMSQWIGSALVQMMACHLFGAESLSKPMLGYC